MKTATSSTKNRPHYWSDAELKKVGIEIRDERRGVLLCKKCGSEWSAEPRSRRTRAFEAGGSARRGATAESRKAFARVRGRSSPGGDAEEASGRGGHRHRKGSPEGHA